MDIEQEEEDLINNLKYMIEVGCWEVILSRGYTGFEMRFKRTYVTWTAVFDRAGNRLGAEEK